MTAIQTVELAARELSAGSGRPLVLLHGLLGSSRNWQTAGADLAAALARPVVALDLRNHGRSPHAAAMDYPEMVADVLAWLDARGWREIDLLGHSLGGKVAMALACRHPGRVARLVVVDIAPRAYLSQAHRAEFLAMNELRLGELTSRGEAELKFEARVPDWAMRKFLTTNLERGEAGAWRWLVNLPALTFALPQLERDPLAPPERFDSPTLFVRGGRSGYIRPEDEAGISARFPRARLATLAAAGHNPHMETRAEFAALIGAWLAAE
jgi:esterase